MSKIILVWAGGTGMSAVAGILHKLNFKNLVCIDSNQSQITDNLQNMWIDVIIWHGKYKIHEWDAVIYSEAVVESIEVVDAKNIARSYSKAMLVMNYFQFLGEISKYFVTVGFTWTNGKSSCTSLAIYSASKCFPWFWLGIVWALVGDFDNKNYLVNEKHVSDIAQIFEFILSGKKLPYNLVKKYLFIVEACEYKRHFLHLDLDYACISSLELDHTDYYKDWSDYISAFNQLIYGVRKNVFVAESLENVPEIKNEKNIYVKSESFYLKYLWWKNRQLNTSLVYNVLSQVQKDGFEVSDVDLNWSFTDFKWIRRRMEYLWDSINWTSIYSDYGHVASSIIFWYENLKEKYPGKKISVIFQPHQIARILMNRNEFKKAFQWYEAVYIYDIYAAREKIENYSEQMKSITNLADVSDLVSFGNVFAEHCGGKYLVDFDWVKWVLDEMRNDEILIFFSAWDLDYKVRKVIDMKS